MGTEGITGEGVGARRSLSAWLDGLRARRAALLVVIPVLVVYLATATYSVAQVNDTRAVAVSAWSLGTRGTLDLPSQWPDIPWRVDTERGWTVTNRFPGAIVLAAPFYMLLPSDPDPGDAARVSYGPAGIAAAVSSAAAVAAVFLLLRRSTDRQSLAVGGALVFAFATATWSVSADAMWTHGPDQLWLALGLLAVSRDRFVWSGVAFAAAVFTRPQTAVAAAVVGIYLAARRRSLRPVLAIGLTSALGLFALVAYSQAVFGTWLPIAGYSTGPVEAVTSAPDSRWLENIWRALIDRQRGLLVFSPFLIMLAPGVVAARRNAPDWIRGGALAALAYFLVQMQANVFHGGATFFSYRHPLELLTLAAPLLLLAHQGWAASRRPRRVMFAVVLALSIGLHAIGASLPTERELGRDYWETRLEWPPGVCDPQREPDCDPDLAVDVRRHVRPGAR